MKRIALLVPGGLGPERPGAMHLPTLTRLVARLSAAADVTAYSFVKPDRDDAPFALGGARVTYTAARFDSSFARKSAAYAAAFAREHRRRRFDLVHGLRGLPCGWAAVFLGMLFRIPSVVTLTGGETADIPSIGYGDLRRRATRLPLRWACAHATRLTALTAFQAQLAAESGLPRPAVIPFGAEPHFTRPAGEFPPLDPPLRILHAGSANDVKDRATLLKTFRRVRDAVGGTLRVAGSGPLQRKSAALARELGVAADVEFLGEVPHAALPEHFRWAQLLLHTSRYEAEGVAVAEGAAAGLLLCGTRTGLLADLAACSPPAAVVAEPGDDAGLAGAILAAIRGDDDPRRRSTAWAEAHPASRTSDEFCTLYDALLGGGMPPGNA